MRQNKTALAPRGSRTTTRCDERPAEKEETDERCSETFVDDATRAAAGDSWINTPANERKGARCNGPSRILSQSHDKTSTSKRRQARWSMYNCRASAEVYHRVSSLGRNGE